MTRYFNCDHLVASVFLASVMFNCFCLLFCNLSHVRMTPYIYTINYFFPCCKLRCDKLFFQPMLCVSAVNPFLFSKVPALLHVMSIRKKIGAMIPHVRCPFRMVVQRSLGIRRYLLEGNDFFALRDLVDLSKGAFAGKTKNI